MKTVEKDEVCLETIIRRVEETDWKSVCDSLDSEGNTTISGVLTPEQCKQIAAMYARDELFRSRVVMARHGFGKGEYKYFSYPLPRLFTVCEGLFIRISR